MSAFPQRNQSEVDGHRETAKTVTEKVYLRLIDAPIHSFSSTRTFYDSVSRREAWARLLLPCCRFSDFLAWAKCLRNARFCANGEENSRIGMGLGEGASSAIDFLTGRCHPNSRASSRGVKVALGERSRPTDGRMGVELTSGSLRRERSSPQGGGIVRGGDEQARVVMVDGDLEVPRLRRQSRERQAAHPLGQ